MTDCGVSVNKDALDALFAALEKTSVADAIAAGSSKLVSMPSGGARAAGGAAAGAAAEEAPKKEEKKEETENVDMGGRSLRRPL